MADLPEEEKTIAVPEHAFTALLQHVNHLHELMVELTKKTADLHEIERGDE